MSTPSPGTDELIIIHAKSLVQCLNYRERALAKLSAVYNTLPSPNTSPGPNSPLYFVIHLSLETVQDCPSDSSREPLSLSENGIAIRHLHRENGESAICYPCLPQRPVHFLSKHVWIFAICLAPTCPTGGRRAVKLLTQKMSSLFLAMPPSTRQMTVFTVCFSITRRNVC